MKNIKRQNYLLIRIVIPAIIILTSFMSIVNESYADCTKESNGFVFLHSIFKDTYWKYSSDSMDITIPQQLCDNKPYRYFSSGTADSSAGLIIDSTGNISILMAHYAPKECQCCKITFTLEDPVATNLKIDKDLPASFVKGNNTLDVVYFAYFQSITSVAVVSISKNGTVRKTDLISLSNASGKSINAISSISNNTQNGFWISGTRGLVRYIPVTASGPGAEVNYDIPSTTDTLISVSSNYSFAVNGAVYEWSGGVLTKSTTLPVRPSFANELVAADNKSIMVKYGNSWKAVTHPSELLHGANIIRSYQGTSIEFIGKDWKLNTLKVMDTATRIKSIQPSALMQYVNNGYYLYGFSKAETLTVILNDPDSNAQLPGVTIGSASIFNNSDCELFGKSVDLPCEIGYAKMYTDTFKIILRPDSVFFESNFLLGVNNILCNTAVWSKRKLRYAYPFLPKKLNIRVGNDNLIVQDNAVLAKVNKENTISGIDLYKRNNTIVCKFLKKSHQGGYLSLWTIDGRLIVKQYFTTSTSELVVPYMNKNRIILANVFFSDGNSEKHKLILAP